MSSKGQLIAFELLASLFGWVWICGGIASLVFTGLALFGEWSWWNVLYAAIISGIGKWLAKGFLDNQQRVAFETDLISKGMSPEEAGEAWLEAYIGGGTSTPARLSKISKVEENQRKAKERAKVVAEYGAFMERSASRGVQICDVKCLPYDKETILDAILLEIVRGNDERLVEILKIGALHLANYQEGIGDQPISALSAELPDKPSSLDVEEFAAELQRFKTYEPLIDKDTASIKAKLLAAERLRCPTPSVVPDRTPDASNNAVIGLDKGMSRSLLK